MAGYETVDPPRGLSYGAPLVDFSTLANWPNAYYQGQQNRRQQDIATAFQNGLPVDANGAPDYGKIMQILAQKGDVNAIPQLGQLQQQAALRTQAGQVSPLLSGTSPAAPPQAALPATAAPQPAPTSPITVASLPAPPASGLNSGDVSGSVVDVVTAKLPQDSGVTGAVINNIARAVGVDANAPLNAAQSARVQQLTDAYVRRRPPTNAPAAAPAAPGGQAMSPAAAPADTASAPSRIDATFADMAARSTNGDTTMPPASAALAARTVSGTGQEPAAQPAPAPAVAPAAATAAAPAAAPQAPGRPIMPPVPLPRGFNDPQQAIMALRTEAARLSGNPYAAGQVKLLEDWASRIETSIKPIPVRPGETLLDPRNGQPLYSAPVTNTQSVALQRFLAEHPDATAQEIQNFVQAGRRAGSAASQIVNRYLQEHPDATADDIQEFIRKNRIETERQKIIATSDPRALSTSLNKLIVQKNALQSFEQTALKNADILVKLADKVDQTGVPVIERWVRAGRRAVAGDTDVSNFNLQWLLFNNEAAKILTNPNLAGALSDSARHEMQEALPNASSAAQIREGVALLRQDFGRRTTATDDQIKLIRQQLRGETPVESSVDDGGQTAPPSAAAQTAPAANSGGGNWVPLPNGIRYRAIPGQ